MPPPKKKKDFEVLKVYSFVDSFTNKSAYVGYYRPYSMEYNHKTSDDFDNTFIEWLSIFNLKNVQLIAHKDMMFDVQKPAYNQIFNGGRHSSQLSITCYGDYSVQELIEKKLRDMGAILIFIGIQLEGKICFL